MNPIISEIKNKTPKPIYLLMGEESYFIDEISDCIENTLLLEEEKGFNQMVLYGRDVSIDDIVNSAKRYPMVAERQVIIIKEAQNLSATIEKLTDYADNPMPSTVLVLGYKNKTLDKRKKLYKAIQKSGVIFESKKLYENQVPAFIQGVVQQKGYQIDPKAIQMLVSFLGNDLSKINNELGKILMVLPKGETITPVIVEENVGISKDFNAFELQKALGLKNTLKANQIIYYFAENPKSNPLVMTLSLLNNYFTQLMLYQSLNDKSKGNVAKVLKINPYFVDDYAVAARNYPLRKITQILAYLREADVKSKGVGTANLEHGDLLKELVFKILH